jgi:hypothetical protein
MNSERSKKIKTNPINWIQNILFIMYFKAYNLLVDFLGYQPYIIKNKINNQGTHTIMFIGPIGTGKSLMCNFIRDPTSEPFESHYGSRSINKIFVRKPALLEGWDVCDTDSLFEPLNPNKINICNWLWKWK